MSKKTKIDKMTEPYEMPKAPAQPCWFCENKAAKGSNNFERFLCESCETRVGLLMFEESVRREHRRGN